jgi:hypothetical protein
VNLHAGTESHNHHWCRACSRLHSSNRRLESSNRKIVSKAPDLDQNALQHAKATNSHPEPPSSAWVRNPAFHATSCKSLLLKTGCQGTDSSNLASVLNFTQCLHIHSSNGSGSNEILTNAIGEAVPKTSTSFCSMWGLSCPAKRGGSAVLEGACREGATDPPRPMPFKPFMPRLTPFRPIPARVWAADKLPWLKAGFGPWTCKHTDLLTNMLTASGAIAAGSSLKRHEQGQADGTSSTDGGGKKDVPCGQCSGGTPLPGLLGRASGRPLPHGTARNIDSPIRRAT